MERAIDLPRIVSARFLRGDLDLMTKEESPDENKTKEQLIEELRELRGQLAKAKQSEQTLRALMEYIPEGITIADAPDVRIRMVSKHGQELTGQSRDTIEDIDVDKHTEKWEIFYADGVTPVRKEDLPLTRATKHGELVTDEEWVLQHPSGTSLTILCNAGPIWNEEGCITGGLIAWRDITERKRAEDALRRSEARWNAAIESFAEGAIIATSASAR
jgi:PAS domain S-box-containing protein